jgi:hypothetical protein
MCIGNAVSSEVQQMACDLSDAAADCTVIQGVCRPGTTASKVALSRVKLPWFF